MGNATLIQQTSEPLCLLYNVSNLRPVLLHASHGLNYPCTDAQAVSMMIRGGCRWTAHRKPSLQAKASASGALPHLPWYLHAEKATCLSLFHATQLLLPRSPNWSAKAPSMLILNQPEFGGDQQVCGLFIWWLRFLRILARWTGCLPGFLPPSLWHFTTPS